MYHTFLKPVLILSFLLFIGFLSGFLSHFTSKIIRGPTFLSLSCGLYPAPVLLSTTQDII